jgi:hypothetical protein
MKDTRVALRVDRLLRMNNQNTRELKDQQGLFQDLSLTTAIANAHGVDANFYKYLSYLQHLHYKHSVIQAKIDVQLNGMEDMIGLIALPTTLTEDIEVCMQIAYEGAAVLHSLWKHDNVSRDVFEESHVKREGVMGDCIYYVRLRLVEYLVRVVQFGCRYINKIFKHPIFPDNGSMPDFEFTDEELLEHGDRVEHHRVCFEQAKEALALFKKNTMQPVLQKMLLANEMTLSKSVEVLDEVVADALIPSYYFACPTTIFSKLCDGQLYVMARMCADEMCTPSSYDDIGTKESFELMQKARETLRVAADRVQNIFLPEINSRTALFWMKEDIFMHRLTSRYYQWLANADQSDKLDFLPEDDVNEDEAHEQPDRNSPMFEEFGRSYYRRKLFVEETAEMQNLYNTWLGLMPTSFTAEARMTIHWKQELIKTHLFCMLYFHLPTWYTKDWYGVQYQYLRDVVGQEFDKINEFSGLLVTLSLSSSEWSPKSKTQGSSDNLTNWDLFTCMWFWFSKMMELSIMQFDGYRHIEQYFEACYKPNTVIEYTNQVKELFFDAASELAGHCKNFIQLSSSSSNDEVSPTVMDYLMEGCLITRKAGSEDVITLSPEEKLRKAQEFLDTPLNTTHLSVTQQVLDAIGKLSEDRPRMHAMFTTIAAQCCEGQRKAVEQAFRTGEISRALEVTKAKTKSLIPLFT